MLALWPLALVALVPAPGAGEGAEAALDRPRCHHPDCQAGMGSATEHQYAVLNNTIKITYTEYNNKLVVDCSGAAVLESDALPTYTDTKRAHSVVLTSCPLPHNAALHDVLLALNVVLQCEREVEPGRAPRGNLTLQYPSPEPPLAAHHFTGLEELVALEILAEESAQVRLAAGSLRPLHRLVDLNLLYARLEPGELDPLAGELRKLTLRYADVELSSLQPLNKLLWLEVEDNSVRLTNAPSSLQVLVLSTTDSTEFALHEERLPENLTLEGWSEPEPLPLTRCEALVSLILTSPAVRVLPSGWLLRCDRLQELRIDSAIDLATLPDDLLTNARTLRSLTITNGGLETLPPELFHKTLDLRELVLNYNLLQNIPSGLLQDLTQLEVLELAYNELSPGALGGNGAPGMEGDGLRAFTHLTVLNLAGNPHLGDMCEYAEGESALRSATRLRSLKLSGTGVTRVCRDWREDLLQLEILDLLETNITKLSLKEIQFRRSVSESMVQISGAQLQAVVLTRERYTSLFNGSGLIQNVTMANVSLEGLVCDCYMYWTKLATDRLPYLDLKCEGGVTLRNVPSEELFCNGTKDCAPFHELPPSCSTDTRPSEDSDVEWVVRVHCAGAGLHRLPVPASRPHPRVDSTRCQYELLLPNNTIDQLSDADIYEDIKGLDLRNNSLATVSAGAAARLRTLRGVLRLTHNPLACSCSHAAAVRSLQGRADLENATCSSGEPLVSASAEPCEPRGAKLAVWLAAGLAVLLLLALTALAALASRSRRLFLKVVLHRWGCLWRAAESSEEAARPFDAFVTFSHEDEAAALELVRRLEPAYRLCVHYRDWTPGRLIAEQAAESVERSRRTVALVSRHFLASTWAQMEFREAHAAALRDRSPRLVVVLLEDPSALPLDATLRRYLRTNTYVRWTDPWLWDKLRVALPPPRATTAMEAGAAVSLCPASVAKSVSRVSVSATKVAPCAQPDTSLAVSPLHPKVPNSLGVTPLITSTSSSSFLMLPLHGCSSDRPSSNASESATTDDSSSSSDVFEPSVETDTGVGSMTSPTSSIHTFSQYSAAVTGET